MRLTITQWILFYVGIKIETKFQSMIDDVHKYALEHNIPLITLSVSRKDDLSRPFAKYKTDANKDDVNLMIATLHNEIIKTFGE